MEFIANWQYAQIIFEIKNSPPLLGFEPSASGYEASALAIILTLQVRLRDVKVCVQQNISNHVRGGNLH